ncbi:MAG: bifunctional adenosylcobinamide kinase/adenosylcobinamide-phosphate guanylyltransferase [Pseudomonadota bacterium]
MKVLYTGGARSGKSARAQQVAERLGPRRLFVATAEPGDDEMQARIARHQAERGEGWTTVEEAMAPAMALLRHGPQHDVVVLDCLTLWVSNLLCAELDDDELARRFDALDAALRSCRVPVLLVSNEVGLGLVPGDALSRRYRDALGSLNQKMAASCDAVVVMVSGLPLVLKGHEPALLNEA